MGQGGSRLKMSPAEGGWGHTGPAGRSDSDRAVQSTGPRSCRHATTVMVQRHRGHE